MTLCSGSQRMIQILQFLTIRKGGVYVLWDALTARSQHLSTNNAKVLESKIAASHAHATRKHQTYLSLAVCKLLKNTTDDKNHCFDSFVNNVKEEVFGIIDSDGRHWKSHHLRQSSSYDGVSLLPIAGLYCCFTHQYAPGA
jgi:CMP-N-acetylneuraminic acid synthetase